MEIGNKVYFKKSFSYYLILHSIPLSPIPIHKQVFSIIIFLAAFGWKKTIPYLRNPD